MQGVLHSPRSGIASAFVGPPIVAVRLQAVYSVAMLIVNRPQNPTTPVAHLVPRIPVALWAIAPERVADLLRVTTEEVTLDIKDTPDFVCQADPHDRLIEISTGVLEILW